MPKDNRNTLAAFDDLLASLEGIVDDEEVSVDPYAAEPTSEVDKEFYDFYFDINNVPRKASNPPPPSSTLPPPSSRSPSSPPKTHGVISSSPPPPPPLARQTSSRNPPPVPPIYKSQMGPTKLKPAQHKSQLKPPGKHNPNKSNLSLKKPAAKANGSTLRVNPPLGTPAPPTEAPQRFLSRGSYNTGASQVDSPPPPPPKEVPPQRFMSDNSFLASPPSNSPPSLSPLSPPTSLSPPKEPAQRFYSTNTFISRPHPSSPLPSSSPHRFMSTNSYAPSTTNNTNNSDGPPRISYIGNRPSRNTPVPSSLPASRPILPPSPPYVPQSPPPRPSTPPLSLDPEPSYYSSPPPPASHLSPPSNTPFPANPPPALSLSSSSSTRPSQSFSPTPSYTPSPAPTRPPSPPPVLPPPPSFSPTPSFAPPSTSPSPSPYHNPPEDYGRRTVNNRKSVRMPQSALPTSSGNICAKCANYIQGEHVMALNKFWCLDHFSCKECNRPLHGVFSEEDGFAYCSDCMSNKYRCVTCGRGVTTGQFYQTEHGRRHVECMPLIPCDMCHNPIHPGTSKMKALDKVYHPECFRCVSCDRQIRAEFTNRSGKPLCMQCSQSSQPKCARCYNSITGQYVAFSNLRYHNECFCCEQCNTRLSLDAFYTNSDKNYCEHCIKLLVR
eukprot:Phypoly_transcript_04562.p1 GENE.Phypoly_transcript_04562~~Phypoly_transcript_04562.p1  ORF type:complete len:664 (-),score=181.18 Phypoly_transcript_04562:64-2055(-)